MASDIEKWMRDIEQRLVEFDRRIRSKPAADPTQGFPPSGPASGDLTGTYPAPTIAAGAVTGGAGGKIADGTVTHVDIAAANKDGAASTPSMRTLGAGALQAVAGNDSRLSDARTPLAHTHSASQVTSGVFDLARIPTGTTVSTVALGSHTHTLSAIVAGGTMNAPMTQVRQSAAPGSIPSGSQALYPKVDGRYYIVDSQGIERPLIPIPTQLHDNANFDSVTMTTTASDSNPPVAARLLPSGWSAFWSNGNPLINADETVTHEGVGYSYRVDLPTTGEGNVLESSTFAVTGGNLVTASVWVRGTGGPYAFLTLISSLPTAEPSFFQPAGSTYSRESANNFHPSATWTKLTVSMVVPAGHTKCRLQLRSYAFTPEGAPGTVWWDDSESDRVVSPPASVVTGEIKMWPTATAPEGYLLCQGGTFDSATYPALAALLGDTFGTHTGSTYYLPDFRARSPIGVGGAAVGGGSIGNAYSIGQKHGHEALHAHNHSGTTGSQNRFHQHGQYVTANSGPAVRYDYDADANTGLYPQGANTTDENQWHEHAFTTSTVGSGNAQNVHPVLGINFIIKT